MQNTNTHRMNSNQIIIDYIKRSVDLTDQEAETFAAAFREVKIKKRQFIVQPNSKSTSR
jgi:hypothetical protein